MGSVGVGITVFNDPRRLRKLLEVLDDQIGIDKWTGRLLTGEQLRIFEDRWQRLIHDEYAIVAASYGVPFAATPGWSCMQGSAEFAARGTPEDWFLYLPDDVLPTPGCIQRACEWASQFDDTNVAAFQIPYWNADELPSKPWGNIEKIGEQYAKDFMWEAPPAWLRDIPRNPWWESNGVFPIVNLNGAGFVLRTDVHRAVGGFSQKTWCLDEDISAKVWTRTRGLVVAVPGPPLVHYMGASLVHPPHNFHSLDAWEEAGWPREKDEVLHPFIRRIIHERTGFKRDNEHGKPQQWEGGFWK